MDAKFTNYKIRGIHLDSCSKYHGIWAGPGTLKKVRPESEEIKTDTETLGRAIIQELREREDWFAIGTFSNQLITNGYGFTVIFPFANDMRDGNFLVNIGIALTSLITFLYSIYGHPTHSFFVKYALIPKHVMVNWIDPGLVTSQFLHAGWTHLIGNMYFLGIFGPKLEARLGHLRYLLVYILFGALTGLIYSGLHHNSDTMNVGASGSISVLMGAYVTFYPRSRIKILVAGNFTEIPSWLYLAFWFTFQAFHAILFLGAGGEVRVAYSAHIIGFCLGLVYGKWLDIDKDST